MRIEKFAVQSLNKIKDQSPLIHNITNFVVMNSTANILLAIGASPVMAHSLEEVEEMTALANALVLNIGTLQPDWLEAMIVAAKTANKLNIPVILDPVGAGATKFRTHAVQTIMQESRITVLRGNASEVLSIGSTAIRTRGVDSTLTISNGMIDTVRQMALDYQCTIAMSGAVDFITDGQRIFRVKNGHPLMGRVTGVGCGLTAVTGAFCAVSDADPVINVSAAAAFYGLCGELAAQTSKQPGSFYMSFIDQLYATGEAEIEEFIKVEEC